MFFPSIEEIATRSVIMIDEQASVAEAVAMMLRHDVRDVVVRRDRRGLGYGVFTANSLIRCCAEESSRSRALSEVMLEDLLCVPKDANVLEVFPRMDQRAEYLGVLDENGGLWGIVSYTDIVTNIDPEVLIERQQVGEIFQRTMAKTAGPHQLLREVLQQLNTNDDAVVIVKDRKPIGIITTKDAVRLLEDTANLNLPVSQVMSTPLETIKRETSIKQALEYIRTHRYKRAVVVEDEVLLGVITQRELVSLAYNRWVGLLRSHTEQLQEVVALLRDKAARLEVLASTDSLTGIANRSRMQQTLEQEISRARRYLDANFSLVLLDVDYFKAINDHYGHLKGDQVLRQLAELLANQVRETDIVARWGGEEFMLLLPMTPLQNAGIFAERLRGRIANTDFSLDKGVRVSLGVAEYQKPEGLDQLFQRVDQALYRAKEEGRDRVVLAP